MTTPEPPISPRGVPQIRTDWLIDVARRLAVVGLPTLRAVAEDDRLRLVDEVDGETWRFDLIKLSPTHGTVVEFDADLWAPQDAAEKPTLRAGFELAPRWDDAEGATVLTRTEIGPRGAVTFDPENWMVTIPLSSSGAPSPAGIVPGDWDFSGGRPHGRRPDATTDGAAAAALGGLAGHRLGLADLAPVLGGDLVRELSLPLTSEAERPKGVLGRLRGRREPVGPTAVLDLVADGALSVAWSGDRSAEALLDEGLLLGGGPIERQGDELTLRTQAGVLTLVGDGLQVAVS